MFQVLPLSHNEFSPLYGLPDDALKAQGVIGGSADSRPGFPCRVSLRNAEIGERVLLLNYLHQPADTPFRSCHAIYVIDGAQSADLTPGELPEAMISSPLLSVRAFDASGMLRTAELVEGRLAADVFDALLAREDTACLHVHFAKYGCFAAKVVAVIA